MKKSIEKIISRLKRDPTYKLDDTYSWRQMLVIVYHRGFQLIRGVLLKSSISASGLVFCGRRVIVEHGHHVKAGKNLILEDGVHINALSAQGVAFGDHVTIAKYSILSCTGVIANKGIGIQIGNNSAIGAQSYLGGQGGIRIGNDVIMGPQVKIFSENHNFMDPHTIIRSQKESRKGVFIGDNCWIGAGVTIVDGVSISRGCVVAAGSVVVKSIPENSVVAGVPAKLLKYRG